MTDLLDHDGQPVGMTLRDWLALRAFEERVPMGAWLPHHGTVIKTGEAYVRWDWDNDVIASCYEFADRFIAARDGMGDGGDGAPSG